MSEILKKERDVVLPGEKLVESLDYLPGRNVFREGNDIFAKKVGLVSVLNRVVSVIPFNSVYIPKVGDMVIGEVIDIQSNGWILDIGAPFEAYLPLSGVREFIDTTRTELSKVYGLGDILYGKIHVVNQHNSIHISMQDIKARKFRDGHVIRVNAAKVPRVIGKEGSMVNLIKDKTGCHISVGQNGMIWLAGEYELVAEQAIRLIEEEAASEGLTDRMAMFLKEKVPVPPKAVGVVEGGFHAEN